VDYAILEYRVREHELLETPQLIATIDGVLEEAYEQVRGALPITVCTRLDKTEAQFCLSPQQYEQWGGVIPPDVIDRLDKKSYHTLVFVFKGQDGPKALRRLMDDFERLTEQTMPQHKNGLPISFDLLNAALTTSIEAEVYVHGTEEQ
jgi:hypothetical protein